MHTNWWDQTTGLEHNGGRKSEATKQETPAAHLNSREKKSSANRILIRFNRNSFQVPAVVVVKPSSLSKDLPVFLCSVIPHRPDPAS